MKILRFHSAVDSELEVKRAGIWSAGCWDVPLGKKAMVTQFFLVTLQLGQAHALRYVMQEDLGKEQASRCFAWREAGWQGGAGTPNRDFSLWSTYPPATGAPPLVDIYLQCNESARNLVHPWRSPRHTLTPSNSRTNHRTKGSDIMQNPTFTS